MHAFLLIGQSNMAGRGYLNEAREIDTSHIYTLRNGRWLKMFRPINPDRSFSGVSLAESFAEAYSKKHNFEPILLAARRFVEYHPHYQEIKDYYGEENLRKLTDEFSTIMLFLTISELTKGGYDIVLDVTLLDSEMEAILRLAQ